MRRLSSNTVERRVTITHHGASLSIPFGKLPDQLIEPLTSEILQIHGQIRVSVLVQQVPFVITSFVADRAILPFRRFAQRENVRLEIRLRFVRRSIVEPHAVYIVLHEGYVAPIGQGQLAKLADAIVTRADLAGVDVAHA